MKSSKSTLAVAKVAFRAARESLPDHRHHKSPKKFTQPQLLACLVVKEFLRLDYRGIHVLLQEWSDLRQVLNLTKVPHFTTLCAARKRLLGQRNAEAVLESRPSSTDRKINGGATLPRQMASSLRMNGGNGRTMSTTPAMKPQDSNLFQEGRS